MPGAIEGSEAKVVFADRREAGRRLAARLRRLGLIAPLVFGIARGGAVVAAEIARELGCRWDVLVPRKIPAPGFPEVAIGAVTEDGTVLLDERTTSGLGVLDEYLHRMVQDIRQEIARRAAAYRGGQPPAQAAGRDAILVDDGVATGYTVAAAARSLRAAGPRRLVLAVPVGAAEGLAWLEHEVDEVVCLSRPRPFYAVSQAYRDFDQVDDEAVTALLREHRPPEHS